MEESADSSQSGYDSPAPLRNPSPPPELRDNEEAMADIIKGTLISKKWIFSILLKLLEEVDKVAENQGEGEESEFGVDVDEEQQDELCQLWDMSMNPEVARFLNEFKAVSILAKVVNQSKAPRINEICVGILGNMCCVPELCKEMAENETFVSLVSALLSNTEFDPLTLKETMRLVYTCLSNKEVSQTWIRSIRENRHAAELIRFVLQSSTNNELLKSTGDMLDVLLDVSDELCEEWASSGLVEALLEAIHQIGYHNSEELRPFMHVFQLFSTSQQGAKALVDNAEGVLEPLLHHLSYICDYEIVTVEDHLPCLCSVVSIVHLLFTSDQSVAEKIVSKPTLLGQMLKILEGAFHASSHYGNSLGIPDPTTIAKTARQDSNEDNTSSRRSTERQHSNEHYKETTGESEQSSERERQKSTQDKHEGEQDLKGQDCSEQDTEMSVKGDNKSQSKEKGGERCGETEGEGSGGRNGGGEREKEEDGGGDDDDDEGDKQQLRILFELLQTFFLDFLESLKLDETSEQGEASSKDNENNPPLFLPILSFLDKRRRPFLTYLVYTLTHALPDSQEGGGMEEGDAGILCSVSHKGKAAVLHLRDLCERFKFSRAVRLLEEALKGVR